MSDNRSIYEDIAMRTGGDIYIGVVGPVRTGKSTFIKSFMQELVLPNINDSFERDRARDEMPQTAAGKTVMTTEPKFVPDKAVEIVLGNSGTMRVKLCDCVGYVVPEVLGTLEEGHERMVLTPWSETPMPFEKAAEIGTKKVIYEHSTVGILVTTDGSIGELPRKVYEDAEKRVVNELKSIGKPFVLILNSANPENEETINLAKQLEKEYSVPVALLNVTEMNTEDIKNLMEMILLEFPIKMIDVELPSWTSALEPEHPLMKNLRLAVGNEVFKIRKLGETSKAFGELSSNEYVKSANITERDCGNGKIKLEIKLKEPLYFKVISELTGISIESEKELVTKLSELSKIKEKYDKIEEALENAEEKGYGIVMPGVEDLTLSQPEIIKKSGSFGVRLKASAPSIHMIKASIETEINPIVGSKQQSEDMVSYLAGENDGENIWNCNLFGKTLYELVEDGLHAKLDNMPLDARLKMGQTLEKIINEGTGGLVCILL